MTFIQEIMTGKTEEIIQSSTFRGVGAVHLSHGVSYNGQNFELAFLIS